MKDERSIGAKRKNASVSQQKTGTWKQRSGKGGWGSQIKRGANLGGVKILTSGRARVRGRVRGKGCFKI